MSNIYSTFRCFHANIKHKALGGSNQHAGAMAGVPLIRGEVLPEFPARDEAFYEARDSISLCAELCDAKRVVSCSLAPFLATGGLPGAIQAG